MTTKKPITRKRGSPKKRSTRKKKAATKRIIPKRSASKHGRRGATQVTPDSQAKKSVRFDDDDKTLLASYPEVRERFRKIYTDPLGFRWDLRAGEESLTFTSHHRLADERPKPDSFRKALKRQGVAPGLIKTAGEIYEKQSKKPFPKLDEARFDLWVRSLTRDIAGEKLKAILASTPESLAKWDRRLKEPGRSWELPGEAVIDITNNLLWEVFNDAETRSTTSRRYYRWKEEKTRIMHGVTSVTFGYKWDISTDP
jgi:hypothetical protein